MLRPAPGPGVVLVPWVRMLQPRTEPAREALHVVVPVSPGSLALRLLEPPGGVSVGSPGQAV